MDSNTLRTTTIIRHQENLHQFCHSWPVFLVGLTIGMMRTVVPALSASEFGVAEGSFLMLTSVVASGMVGNKIL